MSSHHIKCMASGEVGGGRSKYYFFARTATQLFLLEVFVLPRQKELSVEVRCDDAALLPRFMRTLRTALKPIVAQ